MGTDVRYFGVGGFAVILFVVVLPLFWFSLSKLGLSNFKIVVFEVLGAIGGKSLQMESYRSEWRPN